MKKCIIALTVTACMVVLAACNDYETYGELKEKERDYISQFIADSAFSIISQTQFEAQGNMTLNDKEFVKLDKSGVYMQIVRKGCGTPIQDGESTTLLCRFLELNIPDTTILTNAYRYVYLVDKMYVQCAGSTYTASFVSGMMYQNYQTSNVPEAWLVPLAYINVGRPEKDGDEIAKVRLIVPHSQGNASAKQDVIPYYYEITFERER